MHLRTHLDPSVVVTVGRSQLPQLTACVGGSCLGMTWFQLLLGFWCRCTNRLNVAVHAELDSYTHVSYLGFSTYNSDMYLFVQSQDEDDNTIGPWCCSYFSGTFRTQLSFFISVPQNHAQFFRLCHRKGLKHGISSSAVVNCPQVGGGLDCFGWFK